MTTPPRQPKPPPKKPTIRHIGKPSVDRLIEAAEVLMRRKRPAA